MPKVFKTLLLSVVLTMHINGAIACITCNKQIQEAIFDSAFYPNLLAMLSPFIVLTIIVVLLVSIANKNSTRKNNNGTHKGYLSIIPLTAAATVCGIGIGGFIDGIVLHQILQWHEMLSNKIPPTTLVAKSVNMFWDGIFHAFTLLVTIVGIIMMWKLQQQKEYNRSGRLLSGGLLLGWALFNIVEGIADHHILKLHNVRELTPHVNAWNLGFLLCSLILLAIAIGLIKSARHKALP